MIDMDLDRALAMPRKWLDHKETYCHDLEFLYVLLSAEPKPEPVWDVKVKKDAFGNYVEVEYKTQEDGSIVYRYPELVNEMDSLLDQIGKLKTAYDKLLLENTVPGKLGMYDTRKVAVKE